ncbi:hypothetical protein Tcan_13973 [Toxocara canis]|uniref:Uncharacterized protein n=1 Tax=Toxocara canis TaxID=6265 RepID=A0A0B2VAQ9_TOXCA|nr:hypothetical protein Tcan_13973 [Toxocara canis]
MVLGAFQEPTLSPSTSKGPPSRSFFNTCPAHLERLADVDGDCSDTAHIITIMRQRPDLICRSCVTKKARWMSEAREVSDTFRNSPEEILQILLNSVAAIPRYLVGRLSDSLTKKACWTYEATEGPDMFRAPPKEVFLVFPNSLVVPHCHVNRLYGSCDSTPVVERNRNFQYGCTSDRLCLNTDALTIDALYKYLATRMHE